jgi:hypothetical protein
MTRSALLAAFLGIVAGCSLISVGGTPDPEVRLDSGLAALARHDWAAAYENLRWVYENHGAQPVGQHALLALTAAELDPRNPDRRLWASAEMAAHFLALREVPAWQHPVAETMYLLSLELGANEERIARIEAERDSALALPKLPGPSFLAKMNDVTAERDSLRTRIDALQRTLAQREATLKERDQELDRIRRTLRGGGGGGGGSGGGGGGGNGGGGSDLH